MQSSPFRARLPLPKLPLPIDTVCYRVVLPNEPRILEAFEGSVQLLSQWVYWERSSNNAAIIASNVFKRLYQQLKPGNCNAGSGSDEDEGMQLRISPDNTCIIQCFDPCSQMWSDWFDVSTCAPGAITQPPGGGSLAIGETRCYDVALDGASRWRLPVPVQEGDRIVITGASGGWYDGFEITWRCPNGAGYILGTCGGGSTTVGGDPCPSLDHMRLIALVGSSCFDGYNSTINIPLGTPSTDVDFQANDATLADNGGSITFRVCVTHLAVNTWTQDFDFTFSTGGWNPLSSAAAQWLVSTGWTSGAPGGTPEDCVIDFHILHDAIITAWDTVTNVSAVHQSYQNAQYRLNGTQFLADSTLAETPGGTLSFSGSLNVVPSDVIESSWNVSGSPLGTATQVSMHFEGTGTNPFIP